MNSPPPAEQPPMLNGGWGEDSLDGSATTADVCTCGPGADVAVNCP